MVRLLGAAEQASIRFADFAITCTEQMREAFVARGADPNEIGVVHNTADEDIFDPRQHPPRARDNGRFTLICHGSVEERYGLDTAIEAVARCADEIPELRLQIYGEGSQLAELRELANAARRARPGGLQRQLVPIDELLRRDRRGRRRHRRDEARRRSATSSTATRCSTSSRCGGR